MINKKLLFSLLFIPCLASAMELEKKPDTTAAHPNAVRHPYGTCLLNMSKLAPAIQRRNNAHEPIMLAYYKYIYQGKPCEYYTVVEEPVAQCLFNAQARAGTLVINHEHNNQQYPLIKPILYFTSLNQDATEFGYIGSSQDFACLKNPLHKNLMLHVDANFATDIHQKLRAQNEIAKTYQREKKYDWTYYWFGLVASITRADADRIAANLCAGYAVYGKGYMTRNTNSMFTATTIAMQAEVESMLHHQPLLKAEAMLLRARALMHIPGATSLETAQALLTELMACPHIEQKKRDVARKKLALIQKHLAQSHPLDNPPSPHYTSSKPL